jgi:hypothetical protein
MLIHYGLKRTRFGTLFFLIIALYILLFLLLTSCSNEDSTNKESDILEDSGSNPAGGLYLFDYEEIDLQKTDSIGVKIGRCNLYMDIYNDLIIMGEVENASPVNKTDLGVTIDFYNKNDAKIISETVPGIASYLKAGSRMPFYYYLSDKEKYIDISKVKIGVNFKDYHERFKGNPVVEDERYYYIDDGDYLVIEGRLINIGTEKIRNLKLFATFYNERGKVVFIKEGYLLRKEMIPDEEQGFTLKLLLDEYLPEFTKYRFEAFYEDEIKA